MPLCILVTFVSSQDTTTSESMPETTTQLVTTTTEAPNLENYVPLQRIARAGKGLMRYCDTDAPIYEDDKFFDRLVAIVVHGENTTLGAGQIIAPGIFIDKNHVLTSFTPFRNLRHNVRRESMFIHHCIAKVHLSNGTLVGYFHGREKISCARQVNPMEDKEIVETQWHGTDHTHTPLHDLMIMKIEKEMRFRHFESWYSIENEEADAILVGPMKTQLADADEDFPETFKFVSLGFIDNDHIYNKNHLHTSREYDFDDKVIEDCDEWFPRDWGYFFCIKNDDDYVGIGSGAFLVGNEKVFGVGSFALKKGKESILVFTDVRPYRQAMNMTCNKFDGH